MTAIFLGKRWLPLFSSLEFLVGPVTPEASDAAKQAFKEVKGDFDFAAVDLNDPVAVAQSADIYERADRAYVLAMASQVIFDWRGVGGADPDSEEETPFAPDLIPDLFQNHLVFDAFNEAYVRPYFEAALEKNALSRSRTGSTRSAAKATAPGA